MLTMSGGAPLGWGMRHGDMTCIMDIICGMCGIRIGGGCEVEAGGAAGSRALEDAAAIWDMKCTPGGVWWRDFI